MKRVEEAWGRGDTTAVLLIDVKGAIPHVAKGNLIRKWKKWDLKPIWLGGWKAL